MPAAVACMSSEKDSDPPDWRDAHRSLLHRVATAQDKEAFAELFSYFGPRIKSMMLKAGAKPDQAEDLAQETMLAMWQKAALYSPEKGAVSTWLFTIARNLRIDRLRRQSSRPYEDLDSIELPSEDDHGETAAIAKQRAQLVADALTELPAEQRQIMELSFLQDMPQRVIAEELALPLGTVKSRMRLAYGKLKAKLEDLQ